MPEHPHEGRVMPVDSALGDDANPLPAQMPISADEINDYLYDESRPAEERLDRLREIRDSLAGLDASDTSNDVESLRGEVDAAIMALEGGERSAPEDAARAFDPEDRIDTQSPDDEDAISRVVGEEDIDGYEDKPR